METPEAGQNIITRSLPKTAQVIQYLLGDDGTYEAGWWKGLLNANNRQRWIAKTIGGDDIVVDRATGLMWAADGLDDGCMLGLPVTWDVAIAQGNTLIFAGFEDWRLPNANELLSIHNYVGVAPFIEQPPFSNTFSEYYWSSTTVPHSLTRAVGVHFGLTIMYYLIKTDSHRLRCVRKGI